MPGSVEPGVVRRIGDATIVVPPRDGIEIERARLVGSRPLGVWTVDVVATLLLVGKRLAMTIELRDVSPELAALLELVGLDDA